jgi:hypothetical protein
MDDGCYKIYKCEFRVAQVPSETFSSTTVMKNPISQAAADVVCDR